MPPSAAGLSATYGGYQKARNTDLEGDLLQSQITNQEDQKQGAQILLDTVKMFQGGVPGAQPMPQAPAPGQPSQPMQRGSQPQMLGAPPPPSDPTWSIGPQASAAPSPVAANAPTSFADRFGASAGARPPAAPPQQLAQVQAQPQQPMGQPDRPQMGQQYDWRHMAQMIMQARPDAKPGAVIAALNIAMPKMTEQSQNEWRMLQGRLAQEKFNFEKTKEAGKYPDMEGEAAKAFQREHPNATSAEWAAFKSSMAKDTAASRNPNMLALQQFITDETAKTGVPPDAQAQAKFLQSARAGLGTVNRIEEQGKGKVNVLEQLDSAIKDLEGQKKGGPSVTGIGGFVRRQGGEFIANTLGISKEAPASGFETKIELIKNELPRVISGTSRLAQQERDKLTKIVRGLDPRTSPEQAIQSLKYVQTVLRGGVASEAPGGSTGPQEGGKLLTDQVRASAEEAMKSRGWSREQVRKQLQNYGYDVKGF